MLVPHYECHITVEPIPLVLMEQAVHDAKILDFKFAKLYMDKAGTLPSQLDQFCSSKCISEGGIYSGMRLMIEAFKRLGVKVKRAKVERVEFDTQEHKDWTP